MSHTILGPEKPSPFSVISEGYQPRYQFPNIPDYEKYSLGEAYESKMCELVHQYLELGTDDRLCYVGQSLGSLAELLALKFCLLEPVTSVIPGHIHYEESPRHKMHPVRIAHIGAEEYFNDLAKKSYRGTPPFDKVMLNDGVQYLEDSQETYANIMKCVSELGKMLIIVRPGSLNTLPLFHDAKQRIAENDAPYMKIVRELQACGLDVQWEIEILPIIMPKVKWVTMLKEKFPPCLDIMSSYEISSGIRELTEGVLKYEGEMVEFQDRLLFITATHTLAQAELPVVKRFGTITTEPGMGDLRYKMEVTKDIKKYVPTKYYSSNNQGAVRNQILF
ncbi:unnamed protein product [Owenia fusiformis]|uniref:Uncharacterized protein n=1 Tax=Owenia fusiformis TaxID=6347 RepID=A0A8J1XXM1_OWEFU|nr:unnamed protein product [Owenia fusiformis]